MAWPGTTRGAGPAPDESHRGWPARIYKAEWLRSCLVTSVSGGELLATTHTEKKIIYNRFATIVSLVATAVSLVFKMILVCPHAVSVSEAEAGSTSPSRGSEVLICVFMKCDDLSCRGFSGAAEAEVPLRRLRLGYPLASPAAVSGP